MPDSDNAVWNLDGVPDLPRDKQLVVLRRLQARVHELYDALVLAEEFISVNCNQVHEMKPIYKALRKEQSGAV